MHHHQSDSQFQNFGNFHMAYCNLLKAMIQVYKDTQSIQVSGHKLRSRPVRQCGLYGQDSRIRRHRFCVDIHSNAKIFAFRCIFLNPHPKLSSGQCQSIVFIAKKARPSCIVTTPNFLLTLNFGMSWCTEYRDRR